MNRLLGCALIFFCLNLKYSTAQEGLPVYHDYLSDNWYLIHPAMAGASEGGKIRLTARKQWFDVDRAPNLQTLSVNSRLGEKNGLGGIIYNDENGYHSQTGFKLTFAHHLALSRDIRNLNQLSFGISAGYTQSRLDESGFNALVPDPVLGTGTGQSDYFNMDVGMSYHYREFYAHFTVRNLIGQGRDLLTAEEFDYLGRYLLSAGYVFGQGLWQYEPSFLVQYAQATEETLGDLNFKVYRELGDRSVLWGGVSYRRSMESRSDVLQSNTFANTGLDLITGLVGINYNNFMFGYTYSYQTGNQTFDSGGFHQITLGYDFLQGDRRYDCGCPSVN